MTDLQLSFSLTLDQTNTILEALSELPYKRIANLIDHIRQEGGRQIADAEAVKAEPVKTEEVEPIEAINL